MLRLTFGILFLGFAILPAHAAFTNLYVFGDGLSATADATAPGGQYFYGQRWSNGRVWAEVLAQRQGLVFDNAKNNSYWDHNSSNLVTQIKSFTAPPDVANDLFIIWVCNADTFDAASYLINNPGYQFTNANVLSQSNHLQIITNLYAKGVRNLILPNAVDLSTIPAFNAGTAASAIHAGCVDYNIRFSNTIAQARALCPGLTIYTPDFYTLLNNVLANAPSYGLTNALINYGHGYVSIDAMDALGTACNINGPGTNYVFWDNIDPTAEFHAVMADVVQQIVSPVQIAQITALANNNQLAIANVPVGLNGFVEGCTNLTAGGWTMVTNITSAATSVAVFVPTPPTIITKTNVSGAFASADGPFPGPGGTPVVTALEFYRLHFPYAWQWP